MDIATRQHLGCGFEPPLELPTDRPVRPGDRAAPWSPAGWAERGLSTTTCPGYTTSLPQVREIVDAYPQWEEGTLTQFLAGREPTPPALQLLMVFRAGVREHDAAVLRAKAGGAS